MGHQLPPTGYLRLTQIIGAAGVSETQAAKNRESGRGIRRPREGCPGVIPVSRSSWYAGVNSGRFPKPVHPFGPRTAVWKVEDIRALIEGGGK
jgi:prophage regulatory protein